MIPETVSERLSALVSAGSLQLPLLPEAASAVIAEASREDGDARRIADVVRRDVALVAHVLRLANSALYAPRVAITSIAQAMSRLGRDAIRQIALVVATKTAVFRVAGHQDVVRRMFRHAFASAIFAQEIARLRRWNVEDAFLAGLFHDVGRPVLLQALADACQAAGHKLDLADADAALDVHHEAVGAAILATWAQPVRIALAVRHHHDPTQAGGETRGAHLIGFADALAWLALDHDARVPHEHPALAPLGLYPEDVDQLAARRDEVSAAVQGAA